MKVIVAAVGKPRNASLAAAIEEYESRAAKYWPLEVREVKEENARGVAERVVRDREAERLAARVDGATVVACDERGRTMGSAAFAAFIQDARERARDIAFVIGGAYGLADSLTERAQVRLALAPWTLPHELARLVLTEQLYRAGTIVKREPYHK
ncbi:MAG TPA: 23S rRNA (pseudouridine(1915)-N(3))-methyltransferase RlmH [Gemmatimonadaceae bacterium]|nr:23S rRNA (pseudouridine(1915)-N(3))-methyltransferase RlmH [Gemmatimonadaceae bacterium]